MTHAFQHRARRRVAYSILIICVTLIAGGGMFAALSLLPRPVKASGEGVPLLLVSGFAPTACSGDPDNSFDALTTYLTNPAHAWNGPIYTVGIYSDMAQTPLSHQGCTVNLGSSMTVDPSNKCNGYFGSFSDATQGTENEKLEHVACRFAWYVYNTFSSKGIPVAIVAHSLGGLIVRYALGASNGNAAFPTAPSGNPLLVESVVTIGTPFQGLDPCGYYYIRNVYEVYLHNVTPSYGDQRPSFAHIDELANGDTFPGPDCILSYEARHSAPTPFLQTLLGFGTPNTSYLGSPTYWSLIGATGVEGDAVPAGV